MYSVDIKNIVPKESLNCLVTKATLDESMLWHWRLGHVNFKTINKLVKENLVRGLPLKIKRFENDQTCVACLKGKQHKASCKSKIHNSITQPLFMSHIDLFGLTFVSSLMNKKYCLVVTDDYSRFTWVFFLASKDETSGILKSFITEIENLVDKKVKIIRCDNGTEFKNRVMSDFCEKKGIKREFSVSVTILNTLELYGKFDRKSHEGFFVEYSLNSKAFRVYNIRTRKVEESLHIRFLEDKPIIAGYGPKLAIDIEDLPRLHFDANWKDGSLFDSSLKNASNDEPQPSSDAGKKDDEGVCKESGIADQEKSKNSTQGVNTAGPRDWTKTTNEQGFISAVYEGKTHEDLHTCLFACFLSQEEPKKTLVDLPHGKRAIGTKWVYKNKKDERGIVIRNKARPLADLRVSLADLFFGRLHLETGRGGGRTREKKGRGGRRTGDQGGRGVGWGNGSNGGVDEVPDFSTVIAQQLKDLLPTIVAQVGDHISNQRINGSRNDNAADDSIHEDIRNVNVCNSWSGCSYKEFVACKPKEFVGKGGAVAYTRWIKKLEAVQDIIGCEDNQKVKYSAGSLIGKALTWWNSEVQTRGREAVVSMT
ncbi:putative ribonuclease H-like domain-containing protein [Tanacetum coccineum]